MKSENVLGIILSGGMIAIAALMVSLIHKEFVKEPRRRAEREIQRILETQTNLFHPIIVGTNEEGLVVKRYIIPREYGGDHYVYEIGKTKTSNINKGKAGRDVIVEITP